MFTPPEEFINELKHYTVQHREYFESVDINSSKLRLFLNFYTRQKTAHEGDLYPNDTKRLDILSKKKFTQEIEFFAKVHKAKNNHTPLTETFRQVAESYLRNSVVAS